jgi:hypothetical protein
LGCLVGPCGLSLGGAVAGCCGGSGGFRCPLSPAFPVLFGSASLRVSCSSSGWGVGGGLLLSALPARLVLLPVMPVLKKKKKKGAAEDASPACRRARAAPNTCCHGRPATTAGGPRAGSGPGGPAAPAAATEDAAASPPAEGAGPGRPPPALPSAPLPTAVPTFFEESSLQG